MKKALVTGSAGLIGSELSRALMADGYSVTGVDNNERRRLFGHDGDTSRVRETLIAMRGYQHSYLDIRDRDDVDYLIDTLRPEVIIHAAAQPSHDKSASIPRDDFEINAVGTVNLLEAARKHCPEAPFVFMSTNKVYGDGPNTLVNLIEQPTRFEFDYTSMHDRGVELDPRRGVDETFPIDTCMHSPFGASKAAADLMVQEYGRYFGMPTVCLRGGCLTGSNHAGVELHGFLSYLLKCNVEEKPYTVYGYKGKQVRDNIHAADVAGLIREFIGAPRSGEVYNIGGGRENSCSILEAFESAKAITGKAQRYTYIDEARRGDHICYYSDLFKAHTHYPKWKITRPLASIFEEICESWTKRLVTA